MPIRQRWTIGLVAGPMVAALIVLAFFAVTGRWDQLDNPVASIVATFAGLLGIAVAMGVERFTR